jgi:hypothetical protein
MARTRTKTRRMLNRWPKRPRRRLPIKMGGHLRSRGEEGVEQAHINYMLVEFYF